MEANAVVEILMLSLQKQCILIPAESRFHFVHVNLDSAKYLAAIALGF